MSAENAAAQSEVALRIEGLLTETFCASPVSANRVAMSMILSEYRKFVNVTALQHGCYPSCPRATGSAIVQFHERQSSTGAAF